MLPPWYEEIYPNVVEQCTNVGTGHLGLPGSMHPSFILTAFTLCPIGEQVANDFLLCFLDSSRKCPEESSCQKS